MEDYYKALQTYMEKKAGYKKKYDAKVKAINKMTASKLERKMSISEIKMECICCKRLVGTIFEHKNRAYIARCGDEGSPCSLAIEIRKPSVIDLRTEASDFREVAEESALKIIKTKYKLIFGLASESEISGEFEALQKDYMENNEAYETILAYMENMLNVYREDERRAVEAERQYYEKLNELKEILNLVRTTNNPNSRMTLLSDAVALIKQDIEPALQRVRTNRWREMQMVRVADYTDKPMDTFKMQMIKQRLRETDMEYVLEDPKVLANNINECRKKKAVK